MKTLQNRVIAGGHTGSLYGILWCTFENFQMNNEQCVWVFFFLKNSVCSCFPRMELLSTTGWGASVSRAHSPTVPLTVPATLPLYLTLEIRDCRATRLSSQCHFPEPSTKPEAQEISTEYYKVSPNTGLHLAA